MSRLAAALSALALTAACAQDGTPRAQPTATPPTPTAQPTAASPSPRPAPSFLPPVKDRTGLPGDRLVRARSVPLEGARADGTARLSAAVTGGKRIYLLAPARRTAPGAAPALVLVLPAANTTLRTEYDRYGLDALRDHGLTVAVVSTVGASWNAGRCCGTPQAEGVDDVAAVTAVRDDAVRRSGADPARTALLGHSVGAFMVWRLACTPGFGAAAAVAVSGTLVQPCPALARTPRMLALGGALDATVPVDGTSRVVRLLGIAPPSVRESLTAVAAAGRCAPAQVSRAGDSEVTAHEGCTGGGTVRLQVLQGRGHGWADLAATRRAAAFLSAALPGVA